MSQCHAKSFKIDSIKLLLMGLLLTVAFFLAPGPVAFAFSDTSSMTDQTFFGVWDGSTWTTAGKLNYAYNGGVLSEVETAVKAGDYTAAKTALKVYYANRTSPVAENYTGSINATLCIPFLDNILTSTGENYRQTFTVGSSSYQSISVGMETSIISDIVAADKMASFMLFARTKGTSYAEFLLHL